MDKYLTVILIFMVVTIAISFFDPNTGDLRFVPPLFYGGIAGIIIIVVYSSYKEKKARQAANAKRKSKKK
ncbi:MAG: hypothetical protein VW081_03960 [Nitrosopumilus sp.]|jgi:hypothetical protein|nr:hypothetical protein [Nitrosopumilaceae archaeon]RMW35185.1 MAG: hypothetical protein EA443_03435 [Nitrosopumilus sp.]